LVIFGITNALDLKNMYAELKNKAVGAFGTAVVLLVAGLYVQAQDASIPEIGGQKDPIESFTSTDRDTTTSGTATDSSVRTGLKVDEVHTLPVYPGCERAGTREAQFSCLNQMILTLIGRNVRYPEKARQQVIEGKVWIAFIIDQKGYADEVWVERSVHPLLDAEALRVIKMLPRMKPATVDGKPVNLRYTIPINFSLK
jgi:TonB family protein